MNKISEKYEIEKDEIIKEFNADLVLQLRHKNKTINSLLKIIDMVFDGQLNQRAELEMKVEKAFE